MPFIIIQYGIFISSYVVTKIYRQIKTTYILSKASFNEFTFLMTFTKNLFSTLFIPTCDANDTTSTSAKNAYFKVCLYPQ